MLNVAIEEVAKACAASALILMVQDLGTLPIRLFGSDEQKQRFLRAARAVNGRRRSRLSEPAPARTGEHDDQCRQDARTG